MTMAEEIVASNERKNKFFSELNFPKEEDEK